MLENKVNYCPLIGEYNCNPPVEQNSYFLIQPFDDEKEDREESIKAALNKYHSNKYNLKTSDKKMLQLGVYCDICRKIKSSQYCIADISGECYTISTNEKTEEKIFLRPNVALELGMSYGFGKPVFILSRTINGKRLIPSDIYFARYIDMSPRVLNIEVDNWEGAAQKILNQLRETSIQVNINKLSNSDELDMGKEIVKYLENILAIKEILLNSKYENLEILKIVYINGNLIGIIKDGRSLKKGLLFHFYITNEEGFEELVGIAKSFHVQDNGIGQVRLFRSDTKDENNLELEQIARDCFERGSLFPRKNRLKIIIPDNIDNYEIEEIKNVIKQLKVIL